MKILYYEDKSINIMKKETWHHIEAHATAFEESILVTTYCIIPHTVVVNIYRPTDFSR